MPDLSALLGLSVAMYTFAASVMLPKLNACSEKGIESLPAGREKKRKKEIRGAALGIALPLTVISLFQAYLCGWSLLLRWGSWSVEMGVLGVSAFIAVYVAVLAVGEDLKLWSAWKEVSSLASPGSGNVSNRRRTIK